MKKLQKWEVVEIETREHGRADIETGEPGLRTIRAIDCKVKSTRQKRKSCKCILG